MKLVNAKGHLIAPHKSASTKRSVERQEEDDRFVPVIIKRTDQAKAHPDDILERAISEGLEQIKRPVFSLLLSAIVAGIIVGFSAMAVGIVTQMLPNDLSPYLKRLIVAFFYPLGFIMCILSGNQLFTEHTATAAYPLFDQRAKFGKVLRLWLVVLGGNFIGTIFLSSLLVLSEPVLQASQGFLEVAHHIIDYSHDTLLISSIVAGFLMAMGGWLVLAAPPQMSQIMSIYIVTFLIGLGGFHHSIAGSAEVFLGWLHGAHYSLSNMLTFLSTIVIGNLVGGFVFVAAFNYAHIRQTNQNY